MVDKLSKLKALVRELFKNGGEWSIVKLELSKDRRDYEHNFISTFNSLDLEKKSAALHLVCQNKYSEEQIAYLRLTEDLSAGFAFTEDSFCFGDRFGNKILSYKEINTDNLANVALLFTFRGDLRLVDELCFSDLKKIKQFLEIAKNF